MSSYPLLVADVWGIASLRQFCGFPDALSSHSTCYNAPLGGSIVRWDISTKQRLVCFQAHKDLVTVMTRSFTDLILSVSYSGEVKVWSSSYKLVDVLQLPTEYVIFGSWSQYGDKFSVCSRGPRSLVAVYQMAQFDNPKAEFKIQLLWTFFTPQQSRLSLNQSCELRASKSHAQTMEKYNCYSACVFKDFDLDLGNELLAVYESGIGPCELHLFSAVGSLMQKVAVTPLGVKSSLISLSLVRNHVVAIGLEQGVFAFYGDKTLDLLHVFTVAGSPVTCIWDKDELLVVSYISGSLSWWTGNGEQAAECKGGPTGSVVHADLADTTSRSYWIGGIMSLSYVTVASERKSVSTLQTLSYHTLTGCGLAAHGSYNVIASGDFTGRVYVWRDHCSEPLTNFSVPDSVRCLLWCSDVLLIGTLIGDLFSQPVSFNKEHGLTAAAVSDPSLLYQFGGGVVCLRTSHDKERLAVGLTTGYLHVFRILWDESDKFSNLRISELYSILAHAPKLDPASQSMEIWSLCWSPDDAMIATASEDQTTVISDSSSGSYLNTLTGHTTAVTSVDWQVLSHGSNLLITCADDRTVRVRHGTAFILLAVLDTYDIYGWHTLTYLTINPLANELAVVTQNGYVVVWKSESESVYSCIVKQKMHAGSIEGLCWSADYKSVYTVGSDCVVSRFCVSADVVSSNL